MSPLIYSLKKCCFIKIAVSCEKEAGGALEYEEFENSIWCSSFF